jgi:predicted dehydrogenase
MAERLRAGLIGCGFFARNHLQAWKMIPEVTLVAVCDIDRDKAETARAEFGAAKAYNDAAAMLREEKLDFVDIATTMGSHRAIGEEAAKHGVHAIIQKPLAPSWEDCTAIADAFHKAGRRLMVHENFRFQAPILAVRRALAEGRIGKPHFAQISFRSGFDVYAAQPSLAKEDRFILLDLGIHLLDILRVLMGEVTSVQCQTQRINPKIQGEDVATALCRHESGAVSIVDCSYASKVEPDPFPQTLLKVEGDKGVLELGADYRLRIVSDGKVSEGSVEPNLLPWAAKPWHGLQESVLNAQRHWVESLLGGREAETSCVDNLKTFALVMACYDSARTGSTAQPQVWTPH